MLTYSLAHTGVKLRIIINFSKRLMGVDDFREWDYAELMFSACL